jgi:hypothetical protein
MPSDWAARLKLNDLSLQILRNSMEEIAGCPGRHFRIITQIT